jgi:hypothetical protein
MRSDAVLHVHQAAAELAVRHSHVVLTHATLCACRVRGLLVLRSLHVQQVLNVRLQQVAYVSVPVAAAKLNNI